MMIMEVGLEPHNVTKGDNQRDMYTETEYFIKISEDGKNWYVGKESYSLDDAMKKRDEMMDRIGGRRG